MEQPLLLRAGILDQGIWQAVTAAVSVELASAERCIATGQLCDATAHVQRSRLAFDALVRSLEREIG